MEDEIGLVVAKSIAIGIALMVTVVLLIGFVYNASGAKDRDDNRKFDCKSRGGEMIYVKGTGYVCIKGVIKID